MQSSVGEEDRSEVGGLQYTAQNLGSSLGTALIGAILIGALTAAFGSTVAEHPQISEPVRQEAGIRIEAGVSFVPADQLSAVLAQTAVPPQEADAIVESYSAAQLDGLKVSFLAAAGITLVGFAFTGHLPARREPGGAGQTAEAEAPAS